MWGSGGAIEGEQAVLRDGFRDGEGGLAGALDALEGVDHPAFEVEAAVEDDIGIGEGVDVAGAGLVEVGIDPRSHEGGDVDAVAAAVADEIADHADGGGDADAVVGAGGEPARGEDGGVAPDGPAEGEGGAGDERAA